MPLLQGVEKQTIGQQSACWKPPVRDEGCGSAVEHLLSIIKMGSILSWAKISGRASWENQHQGQNLTQVASTISAEGTWKQKGWY